MQQSYITLISLIKACIETKTDFIDIRLDRKDCKNIQEYINQLEEKAFNYDELCK